MYESMDREEVLGEIRHLIIQFGEVSRDQFRSLSRSNHKENVTQRQKLKTQLVQSTSPQLGITTHECEYAREVQPRTEPRFGMWASPVFKQTGCLIS